MYLSTNGISITMADLKHVFLLIDLIWGVKSVHNNSKIVRWPCHCDLKSTIFWPLYSCPGGKGDPAIVTWFWPQNRPFLTPRAHGRRMAGVIQALNHVFLYIYMWFEVLKSFNVIPGSLGDLAIVTWFWPQNGPFLTPPCTQEKDGRGQSGPKSCFPINVDVIWGDEECSRWFQGPWVTLPLWPDFT